MAFSDLPESMQDRIEAAWLEARRKKLSKSPEAGAKHYFRRLAHELWLFVRPDVDKYCAKLDKLRISISRQFGVNEWVLYPLVIKYRAKALRERAALRDALSQNARSNAERAQAPSDISEKKPRRGRPQTIPDERKAAALKCKGNGGSNRDAAKELYDVRYPTPQQVKNVPSVLRHYVQEDRSRKPTKKKG